MESTPTATQAAGTDRAPATAPVLEVRDLHTSFATPYGTVHAVDGVSFQVSPGRTLAIVGESGSGKTVTSRSVMNLLPRKGVTRTGEILFEGRDLLKLSDAEMRPLLGAEMGMIFQDPMASLHPVMKIGKQIGESIRLHLDLSKAAAKQRSLELLRSVKIPEPARRLGEYPHQLSGGMRQRVMIAIAIACDPKLLIADEPTTSLDVTVQAQILDLLGEMQRERHMAMILVSHDLGVVASRADEIAVMYAGKIGEKAQTMALFRDTRMPYTHALLQSIPRLDQDHEQRLRIIGGRPPDLRDPPKGCRFAPRCPNAQPRCEAEEPPLMPADTPGHEFACWYPVKVSGPGRVPTAGSNGTSTAAPQTEGVSQS